MLNKLAQFYCKTQRPDISKKSLEKGQIHSDGWSLLFLHLHFNSNAQIIFCPHTPLIWVVLDFLGCVTCLCIWYLKKKMPFLHCLNYLAILSYIDSPAVTQLSAAAAGKSAERLWCCQVNEWPLKYLDLYVTHISDFIISNHINW